MHASRIACCLVLLVSWPAGAAADVEGLGRELRRFLAASEPPLPGWLLTVVQGDNVVTLAGGLADVEGGRPMDPIETTFPVASVSKTVTATLLVGLAEEGQLELDRDVAAYLEGLRLPRTFREPVTLGHLLTHTSGLDDRWTAMAVRSPAELPRLGDLVARRLPPRVFPPDELIRYSNEGFALAGAVAEAVTGREFAALAEERLLRPLGMADSSFAARPELEARLARGYRTRREALHEVERDYLVAQPAAALVTTARDMARFLRLHLQDRGDVLGRRAAEAVQARRFGHHPALPGVGYGIIEGYDGARRYLFHPGGLRGHSSLLLLLPEEGVGAFLAYNRGGTALAGAFTERFLELLADGEAATASQAQESPPGRFEAVPSRAFVGPYRTVGFDRATVARLAWLVVYGPLRVGEGEAGRLRLRGLGEGWIDLEPAGPLLFRRADGRGLVAFERDDRGRVTRLYVDAEAFERLRWFETAEAHVLAGAFFVLTYLVALRVRPVRPRLASRGRAGATAGRRRRWGRRLAAVVALLHLVFLVGVVWFFAAEGHWRLLYGLPPVLVSLLVLPLVAAPLTLVLVVLCAGLWVRPDGEATERLRLSFFAVVAVIFLLYLHHWNLLGFRA